MNARRAETDVEIPVGDRQLPATLTMPPGARRLVVFAHGSGSSRFSVRNRAVASHLVECGCGTLLLDLLTEAEAADRRNVFDIELLARRVQHATTWAQETPEGGSLSLGLFGASTGAAAALVAAAALGPRVSAVVSRGGRPDLAGDALARVTAPTLLIVGALDGEVLTLNRTARARLTAPSRLEVVPGAGHLFEEPGALAEVARLAAAWFTRHLVEH